VVKFCPFFLQVDNRGEIDLFCPASLGPAYALPTVRGAPLHAGVFIACFKGGISSGAFAQGRIKSALTFAMCQHRCLHC